MNLLKKGSAQAVDKCLKVNKDDSVVVVTDNETKDVADYLIEAVLKHTNNISKFILEEFGVRPIDKFPSEIGVALNDATVSILCAQSLPGELETFRRSLLNIISGNQIRHAHMVNVTKEIIENGLVYDYDQIKKFSKKVYNILKDAKEIKVTSKIGTNFSVVFNKNINWIISDGNITKQNWSNLPDGEVWTCPLLVNGDIFIDGVLGDYFSKKYGLLSNHPLILTIKDSFVTKVRCSNIALQTEFKEYIRTDENAKRIGEFALGTNLGVKKLIGNLLLDEKIPGVHIAVGHPYPSKTGVTWDSSVHCDGVILKPTVLVDGKLIMENGDYLI